ncbi:MAG: 16S rRNA (uracil(1498)-N(3))-methyltransferase [Castellaniella sp.]
MSTARFFYPAPLQAHQRIELPEPLAHHALRVLRLPTGSNIVLFDGLGGQFTAVLHAEGRQAWAVLGVRDPIERELAGQITLVQGIAAGDKMDWIIEKAVELGIHRVIPVAADRSVLRLAGPRLEKRVAHWRAVIQAASEQCGRNRLMHLETPQTLANSLMQVSGHPVFCHPDANQDFEAALRPVDNTLTLLVGPEGGWSEAELATANRAGITPVQFGLRILRTETAGLAMAAAATALLGW